MLNLASSTAFARPADTTAYASGDLVANSTTAGSVVPASLSLNSAKGGRGRIRRLRLSKSGAVLTNAGFRVHLYQSLPVVTNGDNGAWLTTQAGWLGSFDVTIDKAFSSGSTGVGIPTVGTDLVFEQLPTQKRVYALIEARAAYTPVSEETFTITAEVEQEVDAKPVA